MKHRKPHLSSNYIIYGSFTLGLLTAIAFRAIIVIDHVWPVWVRPVWYFAVLGNFIFFYHRFRITQKRRHAIDDYRLIEKIQSDSRLKAEDREVLTYLLSSVKRSRENINYFIIFVFSIIAIALDILLSFIDNL